MKANQVTRGMFVKWRGEPMMVVDKEIFAPGKGAAVSRLKLKSPKDGRVLKEVLKTTETIEDIQVDRIQVQYSYQSGDSFFFMEPRTFEQFEVSLVVLGEQKELLKDGEKYDLVIYEDKILNVIPPKKVTFKVVKAEQSVKGNTVTAAEKAATLENGLIIKVPLFIKSGDEIVVSTESGQYVERAN